MKILESAENYLECILMLKNKNGHVRAIDIATSLGFSKPSVSIAMKNFRENGLITIDGNNNIELTDEGEKIANQTYNRHILITNVLIKMGIDEQTASTDACKIEHVISEETIAGMEKFLQNN